MHFESLICYCSNYYFYIMKLLVISTIWVEPQSSAAGSRMLQLLDLFIDQDWQITYASTASVSQHAFDLTTLGVEVTHIKVNDTSFDTFVKEYNPTVVLYDRFMAEEQFGWRVAEQCPDAFRLLDTEDLHCLRKAREQAIKMKRPFQEEDLLSDIAKREIAAIYRCDLSLMISSYEMQLLQDFFKVSGSLLYYIPFLLPELKTAFVPFSSRSHFVSIGNFMHSPNWDATLQLKQHIWPLIRKEIPEAQLHLYGAYATEKVQQLHNEIEGFFIKGRAESAHEVISDARVLLAPLRFGAGLKGKFIDAMQCGTPSVTTQIGAEAMHHSIEWSGIVEDNVNAFAKAAIELYTNETTWLQTQQNGVTIINTIFQKRAFEEDFKNLLKDKIKNLKQHRLENFTGQMLQHHTMRSTKFMSKWIEEKNSKL